MGIVQYFFDTPYSLEIISSRVSFQDISFTISLLSFIVSWCLVSSFASYCIFSLTPSFPKPYFLNKVLLVSSSVVLLLVLMIKIVVVLHSLNWSFFRHLVFIVYHFIESLVLLKRLGSRELLICLVLLAPLGLICMPIICLVLLKPQSLFTP